MAANSFADKDSITLQSPCAPARGGPLAFSSLNVGEFSSGTEDEEGREETEGGELPCVTRGKNTSLLGVFSGDLASVDSGESLVLQIASQIHNWLASRLY